MPGTDVIRTKVTTTGVSMTTATTTSLTIEPTAPSTDNSGSLASGDRDE